MAIEFNDNTQQDFPVFPIKEENSELDMYGVWIKKKPADNGSLKDTAASGVEEISEFAIESDDFPELSQPETEFKTEDFDSSDTTVEFNNSFYDEEPAAAPIIEFDDLSNHESKDDIIEYEELEDLPDFQSIEQKDGIQDIQENMSENKIEETVVNMDSEGFETLDLDDFLSSDSAITEETGVKENKQDDTSIVELQKDEHTEDTSVELDLSFDKNASDEKTVKENPFSVSNQDIDFNDMLDELSESPAQPLDITEPETNGQYSDTQEITDFDDLINDMEPGNHIADTAANNKDSKISGIDMNITVDEDSDISAIAGKNSANESELDDIAIFTDKPEKKEDYSASSKDNDEDDIIIESTIIEAGNIDEIREENKKILNKSTSNSFISSDEKEETGNKLDALLDDVMELPSQSNSGIVDIVAENTLEENVDTTITSKNEAGEEPSLTAENPCDSFDTLTGGEDINETVLEEETVYFDDIEAVKNELFDSDNTQQTIDGFEQAEKEDNGGMTAIEKNAPQQIQNPIQNDKATEILLQIAGELSNIKSELANLKEEMKSAKSVHPQNFSSDDTSITLEETQENKKQSENNGFFSDDDSDETIALTGDELNNILITADFTEENTKDESTLQDTEIEAENIAEVDKDIQFEESLPKIEPEYINKLPDDVSYLDENDTQAEDLIAQETLPENDENIEVFEDSYLDIPEGFEEENIEEPDLEAFDLPIKELELPNGQSITLGDKNELNENILADSDEDSKNEQTDIVSSTDDFLENDTGLNEEDISEPKIEDSLPSVDELSLNDGFFDEMESPEFEINNIPEETVMSETVDDDVLSAEEFDKASDDISTLNLETNMADKFAEQVDDVVSSEEDISEKSEITQPKEQKEKSEVLPIHLKDEIKSVLIYMDQLLESLPDNKIEEFAKSEHFDTYKRLFEELGIS